MVKCEFTEKSLLYLEMFSILVNEAPECAIKDIKLLPTLALKSHDLLCDIILKKYPTAISDVDECGHSALDIAAQEKFLKVTEVLLKHKRAENPVALVCDEGTINCLKSESYNFLNPALGTVISKVNDQAVLSNNYDPIFATASIDEMNTNFCSYLDVSRMLPEGQLFSKLSSRCVSTISFIESPNNTEFDSNKIEDFASVTKVSCIGQNNDLS